MNISACDHNVYDHHIISHLLGWSKVLTLKTNLPIQNGENHFVNKRGREMIRWYTDITQNKSPQIIIFFIWQIPSSQMKDDGLL